jgi:hypothetical protein
MVVIFNNAFNARANDVILVSDYAGQFDKQEQLLKKLIGEGRYQKAAEVGLNFRQLNGPDQCSASLLLLMADAMLASQDGAYYRGGWRALADGFGKLQKDDETLKYPDFQKGKLTEARVKKLTTDDVVVIHRQQGIGDDFMFMPPYAAMLKENYGCEVVAEVAGARFKGIMGRSSGIKTAITPAETAAVVEEYEKEGRSVFHVYSFNLPSLLSKDGVGSTGRTTIPCVDRPLLTVLDAARVRIGKQLADDCAAKKLIIGMCWQAGKEISLARGFERSWPVGELIKQAQGTFGKNNVAFYSLQGPDHRPVTQEQYKEIQQRIKNGEVVVPNDRSIDENDIVDDPLVIKQIADSEGAFEGTLAFALHPKAASVSSDTSTLHVIGRGLPSTRNFYAIVPYKGGKDWRLEDPTAMWYANMRMFEQEKAGSWQEPINNSLQAIGCDQGWMVRV